MFFQIALACCFLMSASLQATIEPPRYDSGLITSLSKEEIVAVVRPILRERLVSMNYDRIFATQQFLEYFLRCRNENPSITVTDAYNAFQFEPKRKDFQGGPCVSLTLDLIEHLPKELEAYVVAAKLPKKYQQPFFPEYCHTAVLIAYQQGYILLDPSFDIAEPIHVAFQEGSYIYDMGRKGMWEFFLGENEIVCQIHPIERDLANRDLASQDLASQDLVTQDPDYLRMHYRLDRLINPVESSAIPMIGADRRLSFLSRTEDGIQRAHLNIELNKNRIIWDLEGKHCEPISFDEFSLNSFPESFCSLLDTSQKELYKRIRFILDHKDILDSLYEKLHRN